MAEKPKHEIKLDVTPVVEAADKARETVSEALDKGARLFGDFSMAVSPSRKWVSEDNPYRKALLDLMEVFRTQEQLAIDDGKRLRGPDGGKPPASIHQEGRAHAFRDAVSLVQRHMPPEPAAQPKKK